MPDAAVNEGFAYSVALQGDRALISVPCDSELGGCSGVGVVLDRDRATFDFAFRQYGHNTSPGDRLGSAVAIDGNTIAIAANVKHGPQGSQTGAVYVYVENGSKYQEQAFLRPQELEPFDHFGNAIDLEGHRAVVSAMEGG
ncbi:MAG: hypothetical protein ACI841_000581 [Planctomycetota bacterium]